MYKSLPLPLRQWVADQADKMGLPGPDSYVLLLIRLEKQRQDLQTLRPALGEDKNNPPA